MIQIEKDSVFFLLLSLVCSLILVYVGKYLWGRRWLYYYASKMDGPFAFPLIGSAHIFLGGQEVILDRFVEICNKYLTKTNSLVKLWLGNTLYVINASPNDVEILLNNQLEKAPFYKLGQEALGNALLLAPINIWRRHRKVVSLAFNQKILNSFVDIFIDHNNVLMDKLADYCDQDYFDIFPILFDSTLNMICETSLGTKVKQMDGTSQYFNWLMRIQQIVTLRFFRVYLQSEVIWNLSPMSKEFRNISSQMWNYIGGIVESKRTEKSHSTNHIFEDDDIIPKKKIFVDLLIDITDKEGKWSNKELMEESHMMVFAGSETSAIISSYTLVMLAMHQDVQKKAYQELYEIFGNSGRDPKPEDLGRMVYLERVIKETMRLFPVTALIAREMDADVKLEGGVVPKGAVVFIAVLDIHRNPNIWEDPLKFNPDRFLPEEVAKRHRYSYLAFSLGPRDCIGKRYAMMAMKTLLSNVLRKFRVVSTPYKSIEDIKLIINVMSKAKDGYKVKLERRKNSLII